MQSSFGTIKVYISVHFLLLAKGCRWALTVWTGSLSNMAKKKSLIHVICSPNSLHNCHKQTKLAISFPLTISKLILLTLCQQQNGPAHPHNLSLFSCSHHRSQNCLRHSSEVNIFILKQMFVLSSDQHLPFPSRLLLLLMWPDCYVHSGRMNWCSFGNA